MRGFFTEPVGRPAPCQRVSRIGNPACQPVRHFDPRGDYPMYQAEQPGVGNKAIALKNCRNVLLRDFSILKGGHFGLLLTGVDNLTIDNLTIDTDRDGMDIDCCQNVRVSNCTVNSPWDDGICPKSSYALGYARATRNVTIANCFVTGCYQLGTVLDGTWKKFPEGGRPYGTGRIKCGTESNGGFINITITGCVFEGCQGYALETVDGALLEDITISNTTMRDLISGPLFMRLGVRLRGPKDTTKVGTLKRILVNNLNCHNAPMRISSILSGIPTNAIEDVKLSNIFVETAGGATADAAELEPPEKEDAYPEPSMFGQMPSSGFFLRHIRNLEMSHVEIANATPDARPAFYLQDVERADFFAITAPRIAAQVGMAHSRCTTSRICASAGAAPPRTLSSPPPTTNCSDGHRLQAALRTDAVRSGQRCWFGPDCRRLRRAKPGPRGLRPLRARTVWFGRFSRRGGEINGAGCLTVPVI